jgi:RES domain-containing protein
MRAWRIATARHAKAPLDGEGSRLFGGRWSSVGVRVAYAPESIALAVLETLVHYDTDTIPGNLVLIAVDIPDAVRVETIPAAALPKNWRAYPAPVELQMLGDAWVKRARTAVLNTPSALVPEERNLLINPAHPDFAKIKSRTIRPFAFDPRMFAAN